MTEFRMRRVFLCSSHSLSFGEIPSQMIQLRNLITFHSIEEPEHGPEHVLKYIYTQ